MYGELKVLDLPHSLLFQIADGGSPAVVPNCVCTPHVLPCAPYCILAPCCIKHRPKQPFQQDSFLTSCLPPVTQRMGPQRTK